MKTINLVQTANTSSATKTRSGLKRVFPLLLVAISLGLAGSSYAAELIIEVVKGDIPVNGVQVIIYDVNAEIVTGGSTQKGKFTAKNLKKGATYQVSVDYNDEIRSSEAMIEKETATYKVEVK